MRYLDLLLPRARVTRTRGSVIGVSVGMFVCGHKNEHFDRSRPAHELYLLPRAREARTRGRVIGVSGCLFVCLWIQKRAL